MQRFALKNLAWGLIERMDRLSRPNVSQAVAQEHHQLKVLGAFCPFIQFRSTIAFLGWIGYDWMMMEAKQSHCDFQPLSICSIPERLAIHNLKTAESKNVQYK